MVLPNVLSRKSWPQVCRPEADAGPRCITLVIFTSIITVIPTIVTTIILIITTIMSIIIISSTIVDGGNLAAP